MAVTIAMLESMIDAGVTPDVIVAAINANRASQAKKRAKDAARKRRSRASEMSHVTSRDMRDEPQAVAVDRSTCATIAQDHVCASADATEKEKSPLTLPSKENTHTQARAREASPISQDAHKATDRFLVAIGVDPAAPELCGMSGAAYAVATWLRGGWSVEQIEAEAARIAGERRTRGQDLPGIKYWAKVFAKPPPQPQFTLLRTIEGGKGRETTGADRREPWQRRRDEGFAAFAEFRAGLDAAERASDRGG